ncbi:MAG: substrate-binding domain-containing protein, partial [Steroidobacteraceae bacterium]
MKKPAMTARLIAVAVAALASTSALAAAAITGGGSTWVYPLVAKWAAAYMAKTGIQVNYQSIGSGGGIAQIEAGTMAFGASDEPLTPQV